MQIITLTSDTGIQDYYIASIKGAILKEIPEFQIVDISHSIGAFDVANAAFQLKCCYKDFPKGTIHIIGVDSEPMITPQEYSDKNFTNGTGFEVYSISLDKKQNAWIKAINDDKLFWEYHVSDLGGWNSAAAGIYQIRSIPSSVLIDKNGIIIAKNLKGAALHQFLKNNLKK